MTEPNPEPSRPKQSSGKMPPDHIGALLAAVAMMGGGWGGLYLLVTSTDPHIGAELWSFFLLLHIAVTGTALPVIRYLNALLTASTRPLPPGGVVVRQSVWVGLYAVICAWLQILRALTLPIALFLIVVFVVIEAFMRLREIEAENE